MTTLCFALSLSGCSMNCRQKVCEQSLGSVVLSANLIAMLSSLFWVGEIESWPQLTYTSGVQIFRLSSLTNLLISLFSWAILESSELAVRSASLAALLECADALAMMMFGELAHEPKIHEGTSSFIVLKVYSSICSPKNAPFWSSLRLECQSWWALKLMGSLMNSWLLEEYKHCRALVLLIPIWQKYL